MTLGLGRATAHRPLGCFGISPRADEQSGILDYCRAVARRSLRDLAGRPERSDVALAVLFLVPGLAQVLLEPIASRPVGAVYAIGSALPLDWRRTQPMAAALVGTSVWMIPTNGYLYLGYVIAVVIFFSLGAYAASVLQIALATGWGMAVGSFATLRGTEPDVAVLGTVLVVVAPVVAGRLVAHQQAQNARLQELTLRLQDERASAEGRAVAEERARIARELHDVVGHDVTVIALQADAAASAIDSSPDLARVPIAVIRDSAHQALKEMRHVLRGLRDSNADQGLHPQPGVGEVVQLVERARSSGTEIDLVIAGAKATEGGSVELAVYRIVQESLTNARRHAPGAPVKIRIIWSARGVDVAVTNPAERPGSDTVPGFGLVGMRERVRLLGGTLRTGLTRNGEFSVLASLPYENESWT